MSERTGARLSARRREPPGLRRAPVVRSTEAAVLRGWCLGCAYDLRGIHGPEANCPECGRGFVPVDEDSFSRTARVNDEGSTRGFLRRHGVKVVLLLFLAALWMNGLLPQAVRGQGGRLWEWAGFKFGEERQRLPAGAELRLWWWADSLWSAEADNRPRDSVVDGQPPPPAPELAWEMRRTRRGVWTLDVHEPGVSFRHLNSVFNEMKQPGMFGILLDDVGRTENEQPFSVTGTKTDVMSRIVREYGCRPTPFLLREDQPFVWLFDPSEGRLYPARPDAARLAGVEVRGSPIQGDPRLFIHPADEGVEVREAHEVPASWLPDTRALRSGNPKD